MLFIEWLSNLTQTPWKKKLFKQLPTPSEITSFQIPPPLGLSVALRWGWGVGHEYFRELHIAFLWSKMDQKQVKLNRSAAKILCSCVRFTVSNSDTICWHSSCNRHPPDIHYQCWWHRRGIPGWCRLKTRKEEESSNPTPSPSEKAER